MVASLQIDKSSIRVNGEGIRNLKSANQISEFKLTGRFKAEIADGISSPDSSLFALILNVEIVDSKQSFISVFDKNLKEMYTYQVIHPLEMTEAHFILNDKGEMMAFELLESEPDNRKKNKLTINIYSLKNNTIEKIYTVEGMAEKFRSYLGTTANGNFNHYFIKSHEAEIKVKDKSGKMVLEKGEKYELYSVIFDSAFQKISEVKNDFKQSQIEDVFKGVARVDGLTLRGMFLQKNNTFIAIGDAGDDFSSWNSKGYKVEVHNHNGILIINMNAEGKLIQTKVIERSQPSNWGPLVIVTPVEVHDGLFFSYFDSKKESYLAKVILDENGALEIMKRKIDRDMMGGRDLQQTSMISDGNHTVYVDAGFAFKSFSALRINTD